MECFKTLIAWKRCKSMFFSLFRGRSSALEHGGKRSAASWSAETRAVNFLRPCTCFRSRAYGSNASPHLTRALACKVNGTSRLSN